jgi:hypothetical protein
MQRAAVTIASRGFRWLGWGQSARGVTEWLLVLLCSQKCWPIRGGSKAPGPALAASSPQNEVQKSCATLSEYQANSSSTSPLLHLDVAFSQLVLLCNEKPAHLIFSSLQHRTIFSSLIPFPLLPPSVRPLCGLKHQIRFGRWAQSSLVNASQAFDTTTVSRCLPRQRRFL